MAKKNPQDTTLRNVRAAKKREKVLAAQVDYHHEKLHTLETQLAELTARVTKLEQPV